MGGAILAFLVVFGLVNFVVWYVAWTAVHVSSLLKGRRMTVEQQTARFIELLDGRDEVYISMYEMKIPKRDYTKIAEQHGYQWVGWTRQFTCLVIYRIDPALTFVRRELVRTNRKRVIGKNWIYHKADRLLPSACHRDRSVRAPKPPQHESYLQYTTTDVSKGSLR
ncbi:hypothetical protein IEU95_10230 [Hoyosella rhizosphaerae]|uniref:Uncharacterized protein n=1 Tax=Hoyosella rhizosphaerae TaxID=1755582 RepID=A0A916X8Y3_9ACTN|nr:hypothetical protein [Hoyosella rhizosphaerae]MBN4927212.1 hypothetical protein [Hoyosella rhizosphaerae]GGC53103.1 hypothetical protein GCM10011410_01820 [Hoyosella rhizosphaerae]